MPHILLVSYPRSASNLLVQMLNLDEQPAVVKDAKRGYHFMPLAMLAMEQGFWQKPLSQWSEDKKERLRRAQREGFEALEKTRAAADATGTMAFAKEHSVLLLDPGVMNEYTFGEESERWKVGDGKQGEDNVTMLSDNYLSNWRLVFLIRHPAMSAASLYRVTADAVWQNNVDKASKLNYMRNSNRLAWTRKLYDLARDLGQDPLVIDADDVISGPGVVKLFAERLGMDPALVKTKWEPTSEEELKKKTPRAQRMLSTLLASSGLQRDKLAGDVDMAAEAAKWRDEFGEGAKDIEAYVRESMPDYEYMRERRLLC
ncbi:hypothetical protein GE09DRAFT_1067412 [Coniochaeta sp. 2T2.1]|nr:hypothetical protein GE09DRAFT_1067412 [Coniochaeta sp. 2T2.1]